jgi:hypothetical protein
MSEAMPPAAASQDSIALQPLTNLASPSFLGEHTASTQLENNAERQNEIEAQNIEAADGGRSAWRYLFAAFISEALLWGKFAIAFFLS